VVGRLASALKVKVRAPALEGLSNSAVCELLAGELGLSRSAVVLAQASKSRSKIVAVYRCSAETLRHRFGAA
jgi:uncharacterized protein YggU (UPF0235/DUF167 family)